jgi:hypothetical protein
MCVDMKYSEDNLTLIDEYLCENLPSLRASFKKYVNYFIKRHIATKFDRHIFIIKFPNFDLKFQIYSDILKNYLRFKTVKMRSRTTPKFHISHRMHYKMSKVISL